MHVGRIFLLFFSLLAIACNKRDDERPRRPITPALLRAPSCSDTAGEGVFETWNRTEDSLMLQTAARYVRPGSLVWPGYVRNLSLRSRRISMQRPSITIHTIYDTGVLWNTHFFLVNHSTGGIEAEGTASRSSKPGLDSLTQTVELRATAGLAPGCRRLYYFGEKFINPHLSPHLKTLTEQDSIAVLFQGHYDVEVY